MNLSQIQSWVAPIATPAAPAIMLGNGLYQGMVAAEIPSWLALTGAGLGMLGMEFSGALMCTMAIKAFNKRQWSAMWIGIIGALFYALFVFAGIYTSQHSAVFASTVFITLIAYLGSAIYQWFNEQSEEWRLEVTTIKEKTKMLREERRLEEIRARKSDGNFPQTGGNLPVTFRDWRQVPAEERRAIAGMSTAEITARYKCSDRTARNWRKEAQEV